MLGKKVPAGNGDIRKSSGKGCRRILAGLMFVLAISPVAAQADIPKEITVVCDEWKGYTNSNGTGAYWEIVKAVYEPLGIKVNSKVMPWARAEELVRLKVADALVGAYYDASQDFDEFIFPRWPISVEDPIVVIFDKVQLPAWYQSGFQSLAGKPVAWIRGYNFDQKEWLNAEVAAFEVSSIPQALNLLKLNRIAALIDYRVDIEAAAPEVQIDLEKYRIQVVSPGKKLYLKFANTSKSRDLITLYDRQMGKLTESRKIEAIYRRWGLGKAKFELHKK